MNPSHTGYILRLLYAALGGLVAVLAFGTIGYMAVSYTHLTLPTSDLV